VKSTIDTMENQIRVVENRLKKSFPEFKREKEI
jgi:hypothetical protein